MKDTDGFVRSEDVAPAGPPSNAIQAEPPHAEDEPVRPNKPSLKRRLLRGAVALFGLYLLGAVFGLVPLSYARSSVAGRTVVVVSYSPSIHSYTSRELTRVETGGQRVTVRGDVVEVGSGRTIAIPGWCSEIHVSLKWGRVSVTFTSP
jgi:hypothetical protein